MTAGTVEIGLAPVGRLPAFGRLRLRCVGINLCCAGHCATETFGVRALGELIELKLGLKARFADARETWFAAVRKSRAWLKQSADGWGAAIGGKTAARWAEDLAAKAAR